MATNDSTWHVVTVKRWILLGLGLLACSREPVGGSVDGAQIYASVCAACHGPRGTPTESMAARLGVRDLAAPELRERITPALVEAQVRTGSANKLMPAFEGALSEEQIRAVSSYVASPALLAR
jgi:mono/diheme cytochrome c family protein